MGSGSDYTPFIEHLGISSINLGFGGEDEDSGIYHSTYDSFDHYIRFGDPKFEYGAALARTAGRLVLRTADADVIPVRFGDLGETVARYLSEIEKLADTERERSKEVSRLITSGAFKLAADPLETYLPPPVPAQVPAIDFSPLEQAVAHLRKSASAYDDAFSRLSMGNFNLPTSEITQLNAVLQGFEQSLTSKRGLPGRDWYQHMLYAPGLYTGYGSKTMPAVREAIEQGHWSDAADYIKVVAASLNLAATRIDQATALLASVRKAPPQAPSSKVPPPADS
jgi:N-acetylated-alpha-linked acidic dipeptidase